MYNKDMTKHKKGIIASFGVMLFQGWEGIIIFLFGLIAIFAALFKSVEFIAASLLAKEMFTLVLSIIIFGNRRLVKIVKNGFSKTGALYAFGFIIGSGLGNVFYMLALTYAGTGYGLILTSLYPIFSYILLKIFFKEKTKSIIWIGITITLVGGILFTLLPPLLDSSSEFGFKHILGIIFGAVTALCWAVEGLIIGKQSESKWLNKDLVVWKSIVVLVFIVIIIMPLAMFSGNSFAVFGKIMSNWKSLLIIGILAINLIIMRLLYTYSINNAGVKTTAIIDSNNYLIAPIISIILFYSINPLIFGTSNSLYIPIIWWAWFLIIPITVGVFIVIYFNKKHIQELDHER